MNDYDILIFYNVFLVVYFVGKCKKKLKTKNKKRKRKRKNFAQLYILYIFLGRVYWV